jgi:hypothetical protein
VLEILPALVFIAAGGLRRSRAREVPAPRARDA